MLGRFRGGGGPFACPDQRGRVVTQDGEGEEIYLHVLSQDVLMRDDTGQFKVTVIDRAAGVGRGDE
jgi:hypothetical protein